MSDSTLSDPGSPPALLVSTTTSNAGSEPATPPSNTGTFGPAMRSPSVTTSISSSPAPDLSRPATPTSDARSPPTPKFFIDPTSNDRYGKPRWERGEPYWAEGIQLCQACWGPIAVEANEVSKVDFEGYTNFCLQQRQVEPYCGNLDVSQLRNIPGGRKRIHYWDLIRCNGQLIIIVHVLVLVKREEVPY